LAPRNRPTASSSRSTGNARRTAQHGFTGLELLFVVSLMAAIGGVSVPPVLRALDDYRADGAARWVAGRLQHARMEAAMRSADVGVKFFVADGAYAFRLYVDRNRNGVLSADIQSGADRPLGAVERLSDNFSGVEFGALPGLPPVESGGTPPGNDPIRLGAGDLATFSATGSSSTGSVYLKSRSKQYVVRVYGDTGRTRLLVFDANRREWKPL
jgi:type II secretory pathway pseudopilin PulG